MDEERQIQALDRAQPILPLRPGLPERQTHDYERHDHPAGPARDLPGPAGKPRPEAVAGKECGAWGNWTRSTSPAWEEVLELYEKPLCQRAPVVCIDEKPVVLHADTRSPVAMKPRRAARRD